MVSDEVVIKILNPSVISHPLKDIPGQFGIKKTHGQFHQLNQEVGDQGYVDPGTQVKQDPSADKINSHLREDQHKLEQENQVDEGEVLIGDSESRRSTGTGRGGGTG